MSGIDGAFLRCGGRRQWRWIGVLLAASLPASAQVTSQTELPRIAPPSNQPANTPGDQATTTLRVNTSVVLIPTLVEKPSGEIVYGLTSKDFVVEDNGVPQDVRVEDDLDSQPVSIVVAIETGRTSLLQFRKFSHLGPLLELFMGDGHGDAAVVTFDSRPALLQDFHS